MKDGVSVIICCYNSEWIIDRCLKALLIQHTSDKLEWEIIVVNNASTDETRQIAERILSKSNIAYQVVDENEPGLLNARKKGISCANYQYSIFCDDDNLLCNTYVQTAYNIISSRPELGALGGKGIAEFQCEPDSMVLNYIKGYAVGDQHSHSKKKVWGAGMCLKTDVVKQIYAKQKMYLTGRRGDKLLAGDDGELVMSIRLNGYVSDYNDSLLYVHVLASKRLTSEYLMKMRDGFSLAIPVVNIYTMMLKSYPSCFIFVYYVKDIMLYVKDFFLKRNKWRHEELRTKRAIVKSYHVWSFRCLRSIYFDLKSLYGE